MFEDCYLRIGDGRVKGCLPLDAQLLASLYVLPHRDEVDCLQVLETATGHWPWSASLAVAPRETARMVGDALRAVMMATACSNPDDIDITALTKGSRARLHLEALLKLWRERPAVMPADIAVLHSFLACDASDALQKIVLIAPADDPGRSRLEQAVLDALTSHQPVCGEDEADFLRLIGDRRTAAAPADTLLGHIQRGLLGSAPQTMPRDGSFSVLSSRDSLGECEAAVAIIQRWLREDPRLAPADIAVIVPEGGTHAAHLGSIATDAGLLMSSLPTGASARNIGAETICLFLQCQQDPAPQMARASLFTSPILPWRTVQGAQMARCLMQGKGKPAAGLDLGDNGAELASLLMARGVTTNRQLCGRLNTLRKLLGPSPDARNDRDMNEAKGHIAVLLKSLGEADGEAAPDWTAILAMASSYRLERLPRGPLYPGGITVLHSLEMPRRRFAKMIVLGFNDGAYPQPARRNPVFLDSELVEISRLCGLDMPTRRGLLDQGLNRFARQLGAACQEVVLLCAERDGHGKGLFPASCLALIARLVDGVNNAEDLMASFASEDQTDWDRLIDWVAPFERKATTRPQPPVFYNLGRNLLHLRLDEEGNPRPQSPSRLEKLLVSPLAWALGELDAEHVAWKPETLDARLRGTLAHGVFERLFKAGEPICDPDHIATLVPPLFAQCVTDDAPFMASSAWSMEREAMIGDIIRAAQGWAATLHDWGAGIVANEFWLEGEVLGHPVHGKADTLLVLGDGTPVIVDHKKSSSGKRRKRMEAGCDLQVELYRQMRVKAAMPDNQESGPARDVLATAKGRTGVAYNMMNDAGVLTHGLETRGTPRVEAFHADISQRAMEELGRRFQALRFGQLHTNADGDQTHFDKETALGIYAFDDSPLIRAFMREDSTPSAFATEKADD